MITEPIARSIMRVIAAIFCLMAPTMTAAQPRSAASDNAVYTAVIEHFFVSPETNQLVVRRETTNRTANEGAQEELAQVLRTVPASAFAYDDFRARNTDGSELTPDFNLPVPVRLVSDADLLSFGGGTPDEYWQRFHARYTTSPGYLIFSRPGYSHDQHRALVYVYRACGPRCSEGRYVLLRKEQRGWRVIETVVVE